MHFDSISQISKKIFLPLMRESMLIKNDSFLISKKEIIKYQV